MKEYSTINKKYKKKSKILNARCPLTLFIVTEDSSFCKKYAF